MHEEPTTFEEDEGKSCLRCGRDNDPENLVCYRCGCPEFIVPSVSLESEVAA